MVENVKCLQAEDGFEVLLNLKRLRERHIQIRLPWTEEEISRQAVGYEASPEFQNIGFASYNSLEASLTRQVAESKFFGTTYFTLAYTYSHNIENSSGFRNRTSNVPAYNINQFRGRGSRPDRTRSRKSC
jgi:hypothetical protein